MISMIMAKKVPINYTRKIKLIYLNMENGKNINIQVLSSKLFFERIYEK